MKCFLVKIATINVSEYEVRDMNTIQIGDEMYVIMPRSEYADVANEFVKEGEDIARAAADRDNVHVKRVLKFYANGDNYTPNVSEVEGVEPVLGLKRYELAKVFGDGGEKAREIIDGMEG